MSVGKIEQKGVWAEVEESYGLLQTICLLF